MFQTNSLIVILIVGLIAADKALTPVGSRSEN